MATFQHYYDNKGTDLGMVIGSPFCGSPVNVKVKAMTINVAQGSVLNFHRLVVEVRAGIDGLTEGQYITQPFYAMVKNGEEVDIDISSALRTIADAYEYTPDPTTYPTIKFQVRAYDVYRLDGEVFDRQGEVVLPSSSAYYRALMGKFSDMERIMAGPVKSVHKFCCKPSSSPQIVYVGETYAYTKSFTGQEGSTPITPFSGYNISNLPCGPTSVVEKITQAGSHVYGGTTVYAVSRSDANDRYQFRFINHYGVLDSFSCSCLKSDGNEIEQSRLTLSAHENFGKFSRNIIQKITDREFLKLNTGALDRDWLDWVRHEFMMAEHVWMYLPTSSTEGMWVRCTIESDDTINGIDLTKKDLLSVNFTVRLDINGNINPNLSL